MTPPVVDALFDTGLMTAALPTVCGGAEADLVTQVLLYEELSAAEPSAGWSHMACATSTAFAAAFMADDVVAEMFAGGRTVAAGQFAPRGVFRTVDGGFRVTGDYGFASGSNHAGVHHGRRHRARRRRRDGVRRRRHARDAGRGHPA